MAAPLAGKVFSLTGVASGIGLATAKLLLARGALLGVTDINAKLLQSFHSSLSDSEKDRVLTRSFDIADNTAVTEFLGATKDKFGHINGIANIAGVNGREMGTHELYQLSDNEYDLVIGTNIRGIFNMVRGALRPGFLEPGSSIVNISSLYGIQGAPLSSLYCASKAAVIGFTKAAAIEAGPKNIRINAICPGVIQTPLAEEGVKRFARFNIDPLVGTPLARAGEASEVSNVIAFLLGPESSFVSGAVWPVDGAASA